MAIMASKIYADVIVMPSSSCDVLCRTGGQPKSPNVVFREEFIFNKVSHSSQALMVYISMKSAAQRRVEEVHLGHAIAPLEDVLSVDEGPIIEWFPLYDRGGKPIPKALVQLSLELIISNSRLV